MSKSMVVMGPRTVPVYPVTAWTRYRIKADDVWQLVGPCVEKHGNHPLWKQFCAVYVEGLLHGSSLEKEKDEMGDEILGLIRDVKARCKDLKPNRELAIVITKLDEAELWRQRDLQINTPPENGASTKP